MPSKAPGWMKAFGVMILNMSIGALKAREYGENRSGQPAESGRDN